MSAEESDGNVRQVPVLMKSELRFRSAFRRCPKGGDPAFLDDESRNGPLESEILESRSRS